MRSRIGQEVTLPLETQAKGRGDDRLADDRQVVEAILEAEREADDEQRVTDLDGGLRLRQVRRREGARTGSGHQRQ